MTSYNGETITYDAIGNPLSYRDGMTMTWQNGRQLASLQKGTNNIQYSYDSDSIRVSKTINGEKCTFEYLDGMLLYETRGEKYFHYYYDSNGTLCAVNYRLTPNGTEYVYYYTHNWRGDIVGIYNGNGDLKAKYTYDSWGNVTAIKDGNGNAITDPNHVGNLNPFRYRGYYMDTETGMYYLMSRYYDPVTHRFINADGYFQTGLGVLDSNMNAYCGNNPVNRADPSGKFWFAIVAFVVIAITIATTFTADSHKTVSNERNRNVSKKKQDIKNNNKVNIYTPDKGQSQQNKINVSINPYSDNPYIHIENSYQIEDEYEILAIVEYIMESPEYDDAIFYRDRDSYYYEWKAHNILYSIACIIPTQPFLENFQHADLDNQDRLIFIWDNLPSLG
ncbi:RHS repeat-associated core domain-containing protein [Ruminococcus sp. zg-921]|uniref:RHS repeat-associated core domain-containing protein n=1 Tax=Ruminococcus sp. zg-921 TaxID=2678506 RepID=UPI00210D6E89|nr:RHS repeat-associated core domain-containing protein [Ruminococcus sp. zg-921]MCQ4114246.1 hypothetical protein [Ruminococcus sp. zg-921]